MTTSVEEFVSETGEDRDRGLGFRAETSRILEARIDGTVWARLGAMVAYRGDVAFERAGVLEKGLGKALKERFSGEKAPLMTAEGTGSVYFASGGRKITVLGLGPDESITVNGENVLAFEDSVTWDIEVMKSLTSAMAGGAFNLTLQGPGDVAIATGSSPLTLQVRPDAPVRTDPAATVLWSRGLRPAVSTDVGVKSFLGRASGEEVQMEFSGDGFVVIQSEEEARP